MSREWRQAEFQPAAEAPVGFVPQGFRAVDAASAIDAGLLGRLMGERRSAFRPAEAKSWLQGDGFTSGLNVAGVPATGAQPVPTEIVPSVPEPVPVAPAIDAQAVFDAGVAEGERRTAAARSADAEACARMLANLGGAGLFDRAALADRLRKTVLFLVAQVVGEQGVSPERLGSRVDDAVRLLADVTEPARLSLHPDDLAMMSGRLAANMAAVADPAIERGGFRLETLSATIEDGPSLWLDQLGAALDRVAAPGE